MFFKGRQLDLDTQASNIQNGQQPTDKLQIKQKNKTCNQKKNKSIETEQTEMIELAEKDFKAFTRKVTIKEKEKHE